MVYQMFSKMFTNMDTFIYMKQRRGTQNVQAVFFNVHKCFLGTYHVTKQATDAEGKHSHYDGETKSWDWDNHVALHKEQHTIMESIADYGYSAIVCHFLQGIKSPESEAAVNVVCTQPEKYGTDFDAAVSYLGQKGCKERLDHAISLDCNYQESANEA